MSIDPSASPDSSQDITIKRTFLEDGLGDKSSGRLMKIFSFFIASILSFAGVIAFFITPSVAVSLGQYVFQLVMAFLAVATSAELIQKVTKQ